MRENLEEKLRKELKEKGYINRKEFAKYLRDNYKIFEKNEEKEEKSIKKNLKSFLDL